MKFFVSKACRGGGGLGTRYQRRAHGFDWAQVLRVARRRHDILHETVPLDAEAERRAIRQTHDTHRRCDIRQGEGEEMRDVQRWRDRQEVPELVPGTFLKTSISASVATKKGQEEEMADPESGCGVGFHDLADVPGQLRERGADLAMFYNKRFGNVIEGRRRGLCSLQVGAILASASHGSIKRAGTSCVKIQCHSKPGLFLTYLQRRKINDMALATLERRHRHSNHRSGMGLKKLIQFWERVTISLVLNGVQICIHDWDNESVKPKKKDEGLRGEYDRECESAGDND